MIGVYQVNDSTCLFAFRDSCLLLPIGCQAMTNESLTNSHQTNTCHSDVSAIFRSLHSESSQEEWAAFYACSAPLMTRYALRAGLRGEDARDVVATAISKLFVLVSQGRILTDRTFRGYMTVMIRHEAYDMHRHLKEFYGNGVGMLSYTAKEEMQFDGGRYDENGDVASIEVRQKLEVLSRAMKTARSRVAESSWQMFIDVTVEGLPPQDVAEKLGVKTQTVYQRNFQIKRMIREACGIGC